MKRIFNWLILILAVMLGVWATFGNVAYPSLETDKDGFSAFNVRDDLEVISREPHSVEHPENRMKVRDYLISRLQSMGGEVQVLAFDSVPDKIVGHVNVYDIYAKFPPADSSDAAYALLMAHYDSRFAQEMLGDTVYSYGAADDGYGVGVSLEAVREALTYRNQWKQGVIVMLTDVEETSLTGSRLAIERCRSLFDDVSLVFNIEARGVRGPALLFETSSGNDRLMELYGEARYPASYSLTSFIYSILPNFTDFTNFRESFPGYNFSVIDDVKHYHTHLDAFEYISLRSLQHYGAQLSPMLKTYLTGEAYADKDYFRSDADRIFFTVPLIGLLNFSHTGWMVFNIVFALLLIVTIWIYWKYQHLDFVQVGKAAGYTMIFMVAASVIGLMVSYVSALVTGQAFSFTDLRFVAHDNILMLAYLALCFAIFMFVNRRHPENKALPVAVALLWTLLAAIVYFVCGGDNGFVLFPLALYVLSLALYGRFRWMIFPILGTIAVSIFAVSFVYILHTAMTIGALAVVTFVSMVYFSMVFSLWRLLFDNER